MYHSNDGKSDDTIRIKEILHDEVLFKQLKNSIAAQSSLSSIHAATSQIFACSSWVKNMV